MVVSETSWLNDILLAFDELEGDATYAVLYPVIERIREGRLTPKWRATVRRTIEDHSSDSQNYRGGPDLFERRGSGHWAIRSRDSEQPDLPGSSSSTNNVLQRSLETFMELYPDIKQSVPFRQHDEIWRIMETFHQGGLLQTPAVRRHTHIKVKWSVGTGKWANVPWVAMLDDRETSSTQRGVYVVFLFRKDMSGVYVTLNQGVTDVINQHGRGRGRAILRERADRFGKLVAALAAQGFSMDGNIDLRTESGLGKDYEHSTIAYKLYTKHAVPADDEIAADLDALLDAYAEVLEPQRITPERAKRFWIFQANPKFYDIDGALRDLRELTWLVRQHADSIRTTDEVFIWRSGPDAGIIARATVLTDPADIEERENGREFDRDPTKFEGSHLRVVLRIDERIDPPLSRQMIAEHRALAELSILRAPQGTNFPVNLQQADAILELLGDREPLTRKPGPVSPRKQQIWLMAPGRDAEYWDEFYRDGIIAIGWGEVGDLSDNEYIGEIFDKLIELYQPDGRPTNDARALYEFRHVMQPGDLVFAKKGRTTIVGYGIITGNYAFDTNRRNYQHTRQVRWEGRGNWKFEGLLAVKTLTEITGDQETVQAIQELLELVEPDEPTPTPQEQLQPFSIDDAMVDLFMAREEFERILDIWRRKKNVILLGPPGVGKTFIVHRLAFALMGYRDRSRVGMVQFHQSYSYEDFIQGYRPSGEGFNLKDGIFFKFCQRAKKDQDAVYVFIIDEVNRGNLSKILGELMILLEPDKRGPEWSMPLTYSETSEQQFFVPKNLYLLGMMNTADRSLSMVDYALRRRFAFFTLYPEFRSSTFPTELEERGAPAPLIKAIVSRMTELNKTIAEDTTNLGPGFCIGHSFFCPQEDGLDLNESWYRQVIETEILPLLEEYWFDYSERVDEWRERLLAGL